MAEETLKRKLDSEPEAEAKKSKTELNEKSSTEKETMGNSNDSKNGSKTENPENEKKPEEKKESVEEEDNSKKKGVESEKSSKISSEEKNSVTPKDTTPVFGSKSSFGDAFKKSKEKPDIFASANDESTTSSFGSNVSSFGSKSKFGNAFQQTLSKPSFLDSPEPTAEKEDSVDESKPKTSQQYKQVDLEEKTVTTGEENEESVFSATVKVFELDLSNIKEGWKERGVGPLHLNQSKSDSKEVRIVMRSQGLLRVVLNYKITPETELIKGLEASLSPGKFLRFNSVVSGKLVQYLVKFSNETLRDGLVNKVKELQEKITKEDK
ncbi:uncharacterized protein CXQ87_000906 [Candidozyma duobushaemuli]|uniref:RanBD1 domain-containing protein n=2 Tax=Candidozyma TaxID=3303203 RepID=A0ABX8I274_9ASCO|nr:uncharacterized protein CXQ87_000906 [[Candida] duobushaemulonis]PVH17996.1 hypothetical protein CXQ87_000906 [[Candida] duobushaemulonis]QWU86575.1 hypothetical protein CA3LBN_000793 [[Candida] haemuloni]